MSLHITGGFGFTPSGSGFDVPKASLKPESDGSAMPAFILTKTAVVNQVIQQQARNTQEFLATNIDDTLGAKVIAVRDQGRWAGVPECGNYMGAAVYDISCSPASYNQKIWMADVYEAAVPWLGKGILSAPSTASSRVMWFTKMAKFISASQSSSGMKPVFMHARQSEIGLAARTRTSLTRGVLPAARGTQLASKVMLYGPKGARSIAGNLWRKARLKGRRLFIPISHGMFFNGATGFPGQPRGTILTATGAGSEEEARGERTPFLQADSFSGGTGEPWDLMERGRYIVRGNATVRSTRAEQRSFDSIGDVRVVHKDNWHGNQYDMFDFGLSRAEVFNAIAERNDPGEMVPLESIFPSTRGQGADAFMVPTWSTLKKYINEWAKPLIATEGIFIKQGWGRYVSYFESFPADALGVSAPEQLAAVRAMNAAKNAAASQWVNLVGGIVTGIAAAINPIAGLIVGAVVAIVSLIVRFAEGRIPCPPIPMPFMMRSGPPRSLCDFGVLGASPFQSVINVVFEAERAGYTLPMPKNVPEEMIGPLPGEGIIGAGGDYEGSKGSYLPVLVGGAVAVLAVVAISMGKR